MIILFAHFGTQIPKYLENNLIRCSNLFPLHNVTLITDVDYKSKNVNKIRIVKYFPSQNWEILKNNLKHPLDFRKNFWFLSLGRLIAISEFVVINNEEVLHIESDVLIAKDFPFEAFSKNYADILFPHVSDNKSIASTLYIKNAKAAQSLINFIIEKSFNDPYLTDMTVLSDLSKLQIVNFQPLASVPSDSSSLRKDHKFDPKANEDSIRYFKGGFDGAHLGVYLFGDDPRNHRGKSYVRQLIPDSFFDPQKLDFVFNQEREFLDVHEPTNNSTTPIFSLHIHLKSSKIFKDKRTSGYLKLAVAESGNNSKEKLYLKVFLKSFLLSLNRRIVLAIKFIGRKTVF